MGTFCWDDKNDFKDPAKVSDKLQANFLTSNIQWTYREEALDLKQGDIETMEHLDGHLTDFPLKCGYPHAHLDTFKIEALFQVVNYFIIKWYVCKQDLTSPTRS